ncbi:MAG: alpha/beta hydrolase, partial [Bacteroidota bacterium]
FEGKTLRGLTERSSHRTSSAIVILIPGSGKTNFVEGRWFSDLRRNLVSAGLTVCLWDKMGCGGSDGVFNEQQPVSNSADEAIAAIQEIKRLKISGHEKIGLWGLSRGGWICPLINEQFPIDFWISVSGTDDKENFGYLLKSNLLIEGKTEQEAETFYQAWQLGHQRYCEGASYEDFLAAILPLTEDSLCRKLFGYSKITDVTEEGRRRFEQERQSYTHKGHLDKESGLWVYIDDFDSVLRKLRCPVLALFGENDSQVDWRKTKQLYERTIGQTANSALTIKTFQDCNHSMQKCVSCGFQEDLSALRWRACDGYYAAMKQWLKEHNIVR